jgi:nucleoside phosphorylase
VAGKATIEAAVVVENLIRDHLVTRVLMVGIAGSLGTDDQGKISPVKGDVVIATSTAPFELRLTVRETPIAVPVPFGNLPWKTLPTDVTLFAHAHDASLNIKAKFPVHEGLVVTVNGVKDHLKEKARILKQYPGGLAIAEEGFPAALVSLARGVPYLEIRGISDLAQGDKKKQQKVRGQEKREQNLAATNAAKVAVALTKSLSKSWQ